MSVRRFSTLLIAGLSLGLASCGFTPMYGNGNAARGLENVQVETGEERVDFMLQEALLDTMGSRHAGDGRTLRTETELRATSLGIGADAIARRFAIRLSVDYQLVDDRSGDVLFAGSVSTEASYNASNAAYASQTAQLDAEERAAEDAADRITMQLARAARNGELW
jgi:LPS-assembly lipoprotein